MPQKNIKFKSQKAESHDEKKCRSSQHSKIKKDIADQLRREIDVLVQKQDTARAGSWKFYEQYKKWKAEGNEAESEF